MKMQQTIGRNLDVSMIETDPDVFVITAINRATNENLETKIIRNQHDAEEVYREMLLTHALPLQCAFIRAGLEPGLRYTIVCLGDFGFPVAIRFTFRDAELTTYAQYDDAVKLSFLPAGKRIDRYMYLYNRSFLIYSGWRELKDSITYNVSADGDAVSRMSRYMCFDERYMDDVRAEWPDFIGAYAPCKTYRPTFESNDNHATKPKPEPAAPCEILPGLTLVWDDEHGEGRTVVDISPDDFLALYSPDISSLTPEDRLIRALRRAAIASAARIDEEDSGTCNFDSPALNFAECGMTKAEATAAIESAGLSCYAWQPAKNRRGPDGRMIRNPTYLVIYGFTSGQANRRTSMAEAFCASLNSDEFPSTMYYQMD